MREPADRAMAGREWGKTPVNVSSRITYIIEETPTKST